MRRAFKVSRPRRIIASLSDKLIPEDMACFIASSRKQYLTSHVKPIVVAQSERCPICYNDYDVDDQEVMQAICHKSHVLHKHCPESWLETGNTCPNCRSTCFTAPEPVASPLVSAPPRTYGETIFGHDQDLADWEARQANYVYATYANRLEWIIHTVMDQGKILEVFHIDLEDISQGVRFQRALAAVMSAGLALCRFPPNHIPKLSSRLDDWDTVTYLIATIFVHEYGYLMSPQQWISFLAVRNATYQKVLNSGGFGVDTKEWLGHIATRDATRYELFPTMDWFGDICELHWWEVDACGEQLTEAQSIFLMPGQSQSHHCEFDGVSCR